MVGVLLCFYSFVFFFKQFSFTLTNPWPTWEGRQAQSKSLSCFPQSLQPPHPDTALGQRWGCSFWPEVKAGLDTWRLFQEGSEVTQRLCNFNPYLPHWSDGGKGTGGGASWLGMLNWANKYQGHLATFRLEGKACLLFRDVSAFRSKAKQNKKHFPGAFKRPETYFYLSRFYIWWCFKVYREKQDVSLAPQKLAFKWHF